MSLRIQITIAVVLVIALAVILSMVRRRSLELKYVLGWILCTIALLILDIFPGLMESMAEFLGIYSPVNMIFFLGFLFALIIIFSLTVALSRVTLRVRKLAQKMALESEIKYDDKTQEEQAKKV